MGASSEFGPNVWLIDEIYRRFLEDPDSVGEAWREFFSDYHPRGADAAPPAPAQPAAASAPPDGTTPLAGAAAVIARHMDESLAVPTATSVRTVPAKLLEVNRQIINRHLEHVSGGRVSFTHLIGWAIVKALAAFPGMNRSYALVGGKPSAVSHEHVNLGLAVDVQRPDGSRSLVVPNIRGAEALDFTDRKSVV